MHIYWMKAALLIIFHVLLTPCKPCNRIHRGGLTAFGAPRHTLVLGPLFSMRRGGNERKKTNSSIWVAKHTRFLWLCCMVNNELRASEE